MDVRSGESDEEEVMGDIHVYVKFVDPSCIGF